MANWSSIDYADIGLVTDYNLDIANTGDIQGKMFDVPCSMANSFACSLYLDERFYRINWTSITTLKDLMLGDPSE